MILFVLLSACHRDFPTSCEDAAKYEPEAVVGTGEDQFQPLAEGGDLPIDFGSQGGSHVWGGVRARGIYAPRRLGADSPNVLFQLTDAAGDVLASIEWGMPFSDGGSGWVEHAGEQVQFAWETGGDAGGEPGEAVTLAVTVTDTCGTTVQDSVGAVLR